MSLPSSFESPSEYFQSVVPFLKEFSWIYRTSNTQFLRKGVLQKFPLEWINYFSSVNSEDLKNFHRGKNVRNIPDTLRIFQERVEQLKPCHKQFEFTEKDFYFKGMSPKKLHEISRLSNLIRNTCKGEIDILVDFGSGLGYLGEILYRKYEYNILGLECEDERVQTAIERQHSYYPSSKGKVYYKHEMITEESHEVIQRTINELFSDIERPRLAIIGLHACADLPITSIRLFFQIESMKKLIIMPCCYHKLKMSENGTFINFPLSRGLAEVVNETPDKFLIINRPFLRLACQETVSRWEGLTEEQHLQHGRKMFMRAVAECLPEENQFIFKRRKHSRNKTALGTEKYSFEDIENNYEIRSSSDDAIEWNDDHRRRFSDILSEYENGDKLAEGLTCLQTTLQEICENLVMLDRVLYIEECSQQCNVYVKTQVLKIMDDKLSPRCFVLIIEK